MNTKALLITIMILMVITTPGCINTRAVPIYSNDFVFAYQRHYNATFTGTLEINNIGQIVVTDQTRNEVIINPEWFTNTGESYPNAVYWVLPGDKVKITTNSFKEK